LRPSERTRGFEGTIELKISKEIASIQQFDHFLVFHLNQTIEKQKMEEKEQDSRIEGERETLCVQ